MPYKTNEELPEAVKSALPAEAQNVWREVFNKTIGEGSGDDAEEAARQAAWGAVKTAGFEKGDDGTWAKRADMAETHTFEAEVFSTGVHDGEPYTDADLEDMVRNFAALSDVVKPPAKLGHYNRRHIQDGQPALGWVTALRKQGNKLVARFSDVPKVIYDAVKKRLFRRVSSEVLHDFKYGGKTYRRVLYAVGLLGADVPVVKDLADLQAFLSRSTPDGGSFDNVTACEFDTDDNGTIIQTHNHGGEDVEKAELERKLAEEKAAREKAEADAKRLSDEAAARKKADAEAAKKHAGEDLKTFCEQAVKDGKMTPAARDAVCADLTVHRFSEEAPEDGYAMTIATFQAFMEKQGKLLPDGEKAHAGKGGAADTGDAGKDVDAAARKHMSESGEKSYTVAVEHVLRTDTDLAARYQGQAAESDEE